MALVASPPGRVHTEHLAWSCLSSLRFWTLSNVVKAVARGTGSVLAPIQSVVIQVVDVVVVVRLVVVVILPVPGLVVAAPRLPTTDHGAVIGSLESDGCL